MPRTIAFALCRFNVSKDGQPLSSQELFAAVTEMKGKPIAYRNLDPSPDDFTTLLIRPRQSKLDGFDVISWIVADRTSTRVRTRYNVDSDEPEDEVDSSEDLRQTRFVAIPLLGVVGIDDRSGERYLGANSAAARFKRLCQTHADLDADIVFSGTPQDVARAIDTWALDQFTFTVRPSNPHPPKLGEKLDELLQSNNIGKFHATATPAGGKKMGNSAAGMIAEAKSLSDAGYGQYGASGTTPSGLQATVSSPKFDMSRDKNLRRQEGNRNLRVHITTGDSVDSENNQVARALIELYGS